jgi:fumarate reductase (CoM/CoB) subunit B
MTIKNEKIKIKVFRYDPQEDESPRLEEYPVEYYEGMRIWRALDNINEKTRANIAWRLSCREYLCGSCTIMINGQPGLACKTAVQDGMILEPLPHFPIVKDLVIDRDVAENRFKKIQPWLKREDDISKKPVKLHQTDILMSREMSQCIGCLACISICPAIKGAWDLFNGPMLQTLTAKAAFNPMDTSNRVLQAIRSGSFNCTQCGACWEVCPKKIQIPEKAIGHMKVLFAEQEPDGFAKEVGRKIKAHKNPFGRAEARHQWAEGLNLPLAGPVLFHAGCLSSYEFPKTLQSAIRLLRKVGIDPVYFADDEICCGEPLLRLGNEKEFIKNATDFVELCRIRGVKEVITPCAEGYRAFTKDYPRYLKGADLPAFKHLSQVLAEHSSDLLMKENVMEGLKITYQDPCRLGRDSGIYEEPRSLIQLVPGTEFVEMKKNREDAVCCGAGGGVKLTNSAFAQWMGTNRMHMAKETGSSVLITACPWCDRNLRDTLEGGDGIEVKNIIDFLSDALKE